MGAGTRGSSYVVVYRHSYDADHRAALTVGANMDNMRFGCSGARLQTGQFRPVERRILEVNEIESPEDLENFLCLLWSHPQMEVYWFSTAGRSDDEIIWRAASNGVIVLGDEELFWYRTARGSFVRRWPHEQARDELDSPRMYSRRSVKLSSYQQLERDLRKTELSGKPHTGRRLGERMGKHYSDYQFWYYLIGILLSGLGLAIRFI